jgi:hypothetical protein
MNGRFQMQGGKTGLCRKRSMQTGYSWTLIGWKSDKTTYVPLWDRMEGAWLWTLKPYCQSFFLGRADRPSTRAREVTYRRGERNVGVVIKHFENVLTVVSCDGKANRVHFTEDTRATN